MPKVTINGTEIEVDKGTTILRAAAEAGHDVPHFCYHPALSSPANCRMCLVEIDGVPKLQPGCYSQVNDGMVVQTESDRVRAARKSVLEFILLNHPVDCPICDQAGECKLQDYYVDYDAQESRVRTEKQSKVKAYPIGPEVVYDGERCILCTRCIRFCQEVTQTDELTIIERGDRAEIRAFPGQELDNAYSMCTVDICPVGALTARDFRFKCRVWLLTSTDSICTGCSNGCNVHLDHYRNQIQRYRPRYNPGVNDYWMCDQGRLSYKEVHTDRQTQPKVNGAEVNWHAVAEDLAHKLGKVTDPARIAFVVSPRATCEDLYLAKRLGEETLGGVRFFMGGRIAGDADDFLIKADKNPNTRGVEAVFGELSKVEAFAVLVEEIEAGNIDVLYMNGVDTPCDTETRARFVAALGGLKQFIYQAPHAGEFADRANIIIPSCTHAEKNGTFVNFDGVAQEIHQAFAAYGSALPDWQIFMRIAAAMNKPFDYTFMNEIQDEMLAASAALAQDPQLEAEQAEANDESANPPAE